jgi:tetratricopeptide (TPR) repeat protein
MQEQKCPSPKHLEEYATGAFYQLQLKTNGGDEDLLFSPRGYLFKRVENQVIKGLSWFPAITDKNHLGNFDDLGYLVGIQVGENLNGTPVETQTVQRALHWVLNLIPGQTEAVKQQRTTSLNSLSLVHKNCPPNIDITQHVGSAGFACAMAILSYELGEAPKQHIVVSGSIPKVVNETPFFISGIHREAEKQRLIIRDAPTHAKDGPQRDPTNPFHRIVVGKGDSVGREIATWFGSDWFTKLLALYDLSVDAQIANAWDLFRQQDTDASFSIAETIINDLEGYGKAQAHWIIGVKNLHAGDTHVAKSNLQAAETILKDLPSGEKENERLIELRGGHLAIAYFDSGLAAQALGICRSSLIKLKETPAEYMGTQRKNILMQVAGTMRRILHFMGNRNEAITIQKEIAIVNASKSELTRCHQDLFDSLYADGQKEEAGKHLQIARENLQHIGSQSQTKTTKSYLRISEIRQGNTTPTDSTGDEPWYPQMLETIEFLRHKGDNKVVLDWFTKHAKPTKHYSYKLIYTRGIAYCIDTLKNEGWVRDYLVEFRDLHKIENPAAYAALDELLKGNGAPWLRIAPY